MQCSTARHLLQACRTHTSQHRRPQHHWELTPIMERLQPTEDPAQAAPSEDADLACDPLAAMKAELDALTAKYALAREAAEADDLTAVSNDFTLLCAHRAVPREPKVTNLEQKSRSGKQLKVSPKLPKESVQKACELLERWGVTYIEDAVPSRTVEQAQATFDRVHRTLEDRATELGYDGVEEEVKFLEVGWKDGGRVDVGLSSRILLDEAPFSDEAIVHNPMWWPVIKKMLGAEAELSFGGVVLAKGGQQQTDEVDVCGEKISMHQTWHIDGLHLFQGSGWTGDIGHTGHLPPHIVCVFVPLVDFTETNGPTQYHPGSHYVGRADKILDTGVVDTSPSVRILAPAGSAVLYDYRVLHRGTGNIGPTDRTMMYLTYTVPWFEDKRFYRMTSILSEWALAERELEDISIFKESLDRWGDSHNKSDEDD